MDKELYQYKGKIGQFYYSYFMQLLSMINKDFWWGNLNPCIVHFMLLLLHLFSKMKDLTDCSGFDILINA